MPHGIAEHTQVAALTERQPLQAMRTDTYTCDLIRQALLVKPSGNPNNFTDKITKDIPITVVIVIFVSNTRKSEEDVMLPGKLGEVAREFLRDWQVIIRPLLDQDLPLTNNLAERALRHWVIARKISHGTRSAKGTRAFALLASLIDTSRLRGGSAWDFLTDAIHAARHRLPMPPLPTPEGV